MRAFFTWIGLSILLLLPSQLFGQSTAEKWTWRMEPVELATTGSTPRMGMIIGQHKGIEILAGGMIPSMEGDSTFQYFYDSYIYDPATKSWSQQEFTLSHPTVGFSLSTPEGIFCLSTSFWMDTLPINPPTITQLQWNPEIRQLVEVRHDEVPMSEKIYAVLYEPQRFYFLSSSFYQDTTILTYNLQNKKLETVRTISSEVTHIFPGTIQGNGLHNCLYLFGGSSMEEPRTFQYNLFTKTWKSSPINLDRQLPNPWTCSMASGAAHNLLIGNGPQNQEIWSHYAVTDTWHQLPALPVALQFIVDQQLSVSKDQIRIPAIDQQNKMVVLEGKTKPQQQTFGTINYVVLGLYFLALILMGIYFSRRQKSTEDYFKGGGRIPWWAAGISIFGTALSAISFMAIPAKTFATDWAYLFNNLGPLYVAPIIALFFVPFFIRLNLNTAYEYLEKRFNLATRLLGSLSFVIYQIGRIGIVLYLPAIALNVVTGLDILFCIALMGILSVIYTMMGGIEGVIWTDVLQVIILMGGGFLCLVILIWHTEGGLSGWWQAAVYNNKFNIIDARMDWRHPTLIVVLLGGFFSNLVSYSTDQTFVQRYLTATDVGKAQKSVYTNALLMLPATLLFFALGTALYVFYQQHPSELQEGLSATDAIFPYFILSQLPQGVSGLLIAGVFAAAMSTLSSSMNSVASAYSNDFHARFGWRGSPLSVARWSTLVTGLIGTVFAMLMATSDIKSVWDEFLKIIGLITGGLGGIFVLGMLSKRANGSGALIGLLGSALIQYWLGVTKPIHLLLFTATGFFSAVSIGWIASWFFKPPPPSEIP